MTSLQKWVVGATLGIAVGAWVFEAHHNSELREEIRTLRREQPSLAERIRKLEQEQGKTQHQLTALQNEPQPSARTNAAVAPLRKTTSIPMLPSAAVEDALDRACAETKPGRREAAFEEIEKSISPADLPRALAYLAARPGMGGVESPLFSELAVKWGDSDPAAAAAWANGLSDASAKKAALLGVLKGWTHVSPESAAGYAANLPAGDLQDALVMKVVNEWSFRDARGAADWVSAFPEGQLRDKAVGPIIFWGQGQSPAAIADMLDAIGNDQLTKEHGETLASIWLSRDAAAARAWIARSPLSDEAKQRLLKRADEEK
jgi:hypothetical protein